MKISESSLRKLRLARGRGGMTLVEIVLSLGIFAVLVLMSLYVLAASVNRNRATELTVAGTMAARQAIEELVSLSENTVTTEATGADTQGTYCRPLELVRYLLSDKVPDEYVVTRHGGAHLTRVTCVFPSMRAGQAMRDSSGDKYYDLPKDSTDIADAGSTVTVILYLDEGSVPVSPYDPTSVRLWSDLSTTGSVGTHDGFDINGDGIITQGGYLSNSNDPDFNLASLGSGYRRITHLPIDVIVDYTAKNAIGGRVRESQSLNYRMIITDFSSLN